MAEFGRTSKRHSALEHQPPLIVFALLGTFAFPVAAQSGDPSGGSTKSAWYMYFGNYPVTASWSVHLEGQYRREGVVQRWEQLLVRPGVERKLGHGMTVLVAYTYLRDYPFEGGSLGDTTTTGPQPEHRILEEFKWKHLLIGSSRQAITLTHRFRAEQRFEGTSTTDVGTTQWDFAERARYRITANIPIRWNTGGLRPDYVSVYDEVFVNFGPHGTDNALNQNRVFGAVGWNLSQHAQLEVGYMEQYSPVPNGVVNTHNHALQVAIYSTAPLKKLFGARP